MATIFPINQATPKEKSPRPEQNGIQWQESFQQWKLRKASKSLSLEKKRHEASYPSQNECYPASGTVPIAPASPLLTGVPFVSGLP